MDGPICRLTMGSPKGEDRRAASEDQVSVTLSKGFWLGKYEVTQSEWQQIMGTTLAEQKAKQDMYGNITATGPRQPMYFVNHDEATAFCAKLTDQERVAGRLPADWKYELPTEAQWEYACRAGTTTATAFGNSLSSTLANFDGKYSAPLNFDGKAPKGTTLETTTEVGSYKPNSWGLYDMHGNVSEWCSGWYSDKLNGGRDPAVLQASGAGYRVNRGGGCFTIGQGLRSAYRNQCAPGVGGHDLGFRLATVQSK